MRNHLDGATTLVTRRSFLQAAWQRIARGCRPLAVGFTAIADDVVWLMRWCCFGGGLRYAGAG